jgi:hypothetical protein
MSDTHLVRKGLLTAGCVVAALVAPVSAQAGTVPVKGQVVGSAYAAGGKSAVPVLLSQVSARRAHLKSPLGIALMSPAASIPAPGGSLKASALRLGDSISARLRTSKSLRSSAYPRFAARGLRVTRRGATLSNAELYALVAKLQNQLDGFQSYVLGELSRLGNLIGGLTSQGASTRSQLDSLTSTLNTVSSGLTQLQTAVGNLPANVQSEIDALTSQVQALQSVASTLQSQLGSATSSIATLQGLLSGITTPGQLSTALNNISTLQSQLASLSGLVGSLSSQINGAGGVAADVSALCSDISVLNLNLPLLGLGLCP